MSDEQRKQFEAWANKQVLWQHFDVGIDWTGVQYDEMELDLAWDAFRAGQQARDAEVQALREELLNYVSADEMAVGEGYGTYPSSEHRRIRALVAGEAGETE